MKIIKIVEYKQYVNRLDGRTASIFSSYRGPDWEIQTKGYTFKLDNGICGIGRGPVSTIEEAMIIMDKYNNGK